MARFPRPWLGLKGKGSSRRLRTRPSKTGSSAAFTASGRQAIQRFEEDQASSVESFSNYLAGLSELEREVIGSFLSQVDEFLKGLG